VPARPSELDAWLARIEKQHARPAIDLSAESLARVRAVADRLGIGLSCPTLIVGGTNGKGSTCAMLDSMLRAGGFRIARYTSPHLLRFNERAAIDGKDVDDHVMIESFEAVESARGVTPLTYFEFTTLAVFRWFSRERLDAAVLEVGLGGRLDAVNIIDPDCAIVTSIDLDHMDYLGPTREHIGFEKAHIYRKGRPAICCDPMPPQSVVDVANRIGADLWRFGRDFNYRALSYGDGPQARATQQWSYAGRGVRRASLPYPALRGANQLLNASGALAALEALADRLPLSQQAVRQGLLNVQIPARFQVLPGRPTVILDVAHNPHAAAVLAQNLDSQGFFPSTHAVFGMLRDKDAEGVVRHLRERVDVWHVGPTFGERGLDAAPLAERVRAIVAPATAVHAYPSIGEAVLAARESATPEDRIVAFGSFASVADAMRALGAAASTTE
jgi:dihydrofolate synthase/folylpolyglutamate synthase